MQPGFDILPQAAAERPSVLTQALTQLLHSCAVVMNIEHSIAACTVHATGNARLINKSLHLWPLSSQYVVLRLKESLVVAQS